MAMTYFKREITQREKPCIGIFADAYCGKTRLCATASEFAAMQGTVPGWLILDRKSRQTIEALHLEQGYDLPYINTKDFLDPRGALKLALTDNDEETKKIYAEAFDRMTEAMSQLADNKDVDPIIIDNGTEMWDWIGYARLGRREGKLQRYWGPANRDWKEFFGALNHKTTLITLQEKKYDKDKPSEPDGPPNLKYTTTSLIRLTKKESKNIVTAYGLDVYQSIDNKAMEGVDNLLTNDEITVSNLIMQIRPDMIG